MTGLRSVCFHCCLTLREKLKADYALEETPLYHHQPKGLHADPCSCLSFTIAHRRNNVKEPGRWSRCWPTRQHSREKSLAATICPAIKSLRCSSNRTDRAVHNRRAHIEMPMMLACCLHTTSSPGFDKGRCDRRPRRGHTERRSLRCFDLVI